MRCSNAPSASPIFQEQVIKLAMVAAGSPGEADQLRRAMWRPGSGAAGSKPFEQRLMARHHGTWLPTRDLPKRVYRQILGFGDYGFPNRMPPALRCWCMSRPGSKRHHPAAFCAALINSQPMDAMLADKLVRDARGHGVTVLPADVNQSDWDCTPGTHRRAVGQDIAERARLLTDLPMP